MDCVKLNDKVLLLGTLLAPEGLNVPEITTVSFDSINVFLSENVEQLNNEFNVVISTLYNDSRIISSEVLAKLLKFMKPNAKFIFHDSSASPEEVVSHLKVNGFINATFTKIQNCENVLVNEIYCEKPSFEIGSSVKLSLPVGKENVSSVWKLDDDDNEVINDEELLDADDLKKPDPSSLRVCGTTGKRKACKDCSCGLAEELQGEGAAAKDLNPVQKSSCGSCYLGDAFRCASCPYLGMPAFKPGEKVKLSDMQLNPDL